MFLFQTCKRCTKNECFVKRRLYLAALVPLHLIFFFPSVFHTRIPPSSHGSLIPKLATAACHVIGDFLSLYMMCFYSFHFLEAWSELKLLVEFPVKTGHLFSKCNRCQAFDWPLPLAIALCTVYLFFPLGLQMLVEPTAVCRYRLSVQGRPCPCETSHMRKRGRFNRSFHHLLQLAFCVCSGRCRGFVHWLVKLNRCLFSFLSFSSLTPSLSLVLWVGGCKNCPGVCPPETAL